MSINKYGERYVLIPVEALGTFLVIAYVYIDHGFEVCIEVFKDCDQTKVGIGECDFDLRRNVATLILYHRYDVATNDAIDRLAHLLGECHGVTVLTVKDLDEIYE